MTQGTLSPETQPVSARFTPRTVMFAVGLVSFASLLLELALTRLFSVVLFYHFAFFAISVALLGLGSGGVFAHIRRERLGRFPLDALGAWLCLINSLCILGAVEVVLHTPVSLQVTGPNFLKLTIIYLAAAVPFFLTGLLFSMVFARSPGAISFLYGADLAGGAMACLAVVPLLNLIGAPNALLLASLAMAASAALWAGQNRLRVLGLALAGVFALLIAANHSGRLLDVVYAKGQLRDSQWVEFAKWNAISRIEVNNQNGARYAVIDADATTAIMNADPAKWDQDQPTNPTPTHTGLPAEPGFNWKKSLMAGAPAVANVLRPKGDFAIIGPGGGVDVLRAVANGSPSVTGIEINPTIVHDVMRGQYADYSYRLYDRPEVHIHVQDGRSYIRGAGKKYDVLQMTLVDTWASTAAGAFALSENNLYTVEAFREYFDHLKPDGMIAITRWEFRQPREALRVVSQEIEALRRMGVIEWPGAEYWRHFIVVSDGDLNVDGRPVVVLAKKSAFTEDEEIAAIYHVQHNENLHVLYTPGMARGREFAAYPQVAKCSETSSSAYCGALKYVAQHPADVAAAEPFYQLIAKHDVYKEIFTGHPGLQYSARNDYIARYPFNIAPVDDNAPFFFFTLKTGYVLKNIAAGTGKGMDWRINLGVVVLGMLLIISLLAVLAFLVLPLALHRRHEAARRTSLAALLYFIAVGFGYILVEISLIQRFVLFLGHPTYALTVVVFLLLLSSGCGSVAARRWIAGHFSLLRALSLIAVLIGLNLFFLPLLLAAAVGLPFLAKLAISGAVLAPLGFFMGMPFPSGLRLVETVEWAWALNAAASVLGSVMAMVIAIHFGLTATLACAAAAYLIAAACSRTWRGTPLPAPEPVS
ncbi:MAG TPA: hypothetical protein VF532_24385 [Candidatus Angelobacter sp.]